MFCFLFFFISCKSESHSINLKLAKVIIKQFEKVNNDSLIFLDNYSINQNYYSPKNLSKLKMNYFKSLIKNHSFLEIHGMKSDAIEIIFNEEIDSYSLTKSRFSGIIFTLKELKETEKFSHLSNETLFEFEMLENNYYYFSYQKIESIHS